MQAWFQHAVVETGRLPLASCLAAMIVTFALIRVSVRLIRAEVRWWFRNVNVGGLHVHHAAWGIVLMLVGGMAGLAMPAGLLAWRALAGALFGVGAALVLDEFSLILHLRDVYWTQEGRLSVDAVFVAVAFAGLILLGFHPIVIADLTTSNDEPAALGGGLALAGANLALAVVTMLKGKLWTGLVGLFIPVLLIVGAVRLARPESPWSRWRYPPGSGRFRRAYWREVRLRRPIVRAKVWFQELIAGRHDLPHDQVRRAGSSDRG